MASVDAYVKGHSSTKPSGMPQSPPSVNTPTSPLPPLPPSDPLDSSPSSPQQIYLNLLILEHSLRSQYCALQLRRRKYTFFFVLLIVWTSWFFHRVFLSTGSPYTYIYTLERLAFSVGITTIGLFYLTGLYRKTLVYPRKFVHNTNKGLRQFNLKLVSVKVPFRQKLLHFYYELFPPPSYKQKTKSASPLPRRKRATSSVSRKHLPSSSISSISGISASAAAVAAAATNSPDKRAHKRLSTAGSLPSTSSEDDRPRSSHGGHDADQIIDPADLIPSGSHIKLVVLAKGFSAEFREGWEIYREEYWEKENATRTHLRAEAKKQAKLERGKWWKWESWRRAKKEPEKEKEDVVPTARRTRRLSSNVGSGVKRRSLLRPDDSTPRSTTPEAEKEKKEAARKSAKMKRKVSSGGAGGSGGGGVPNAAAPA